MANKLDSNLSVVLYTNPLLINYIYMKSSIGLQFAFTWRSCLTWHNVSLGARSPRRSVVLAFGRLALGRLALRLLGVPSLGVPSRHPPSVLSLGWGKMYRSD